MLETPHIGSPLWGVRVCRRRVRASWLRFGPAVPRAAGRSGSLRKRFLRRFVLGLCVGLWLPAAGVAAAERAVDLELVLAVDVSGSIDIDEAVLQRQGYLQALRHPSVVEAIEHGRLGRIAVTYVEWAGNLFQSTVVDWQEISDARSAAAFAEALEREAVTTELWTSISTAIDFAALKFENNGFRGRRQVIDISGDGPNNSGAFVIEARDRALAKEIVINGLAIINGRPGRFGYPPLPNLDLYYEDCVIGGQNAFVEVAEGFGDFGRAILRKMLLEIAGRSPPRRLLWPATERFRPPCDAGELQLRNWSPDYDEY